MIYRGHDISIREMPDSFQYEVRDGAKKIVAHGNVRSRSNAEAAAMLDIDRIKKRATTTSAA